MSSNEDDGGTTIVQNITKVTVPDWISSRRSEILALTGVAGTLVSFATDPLGFVLDELLPWLVGGILDGWAVVLGSLSGVWEPIAGIPDSVADPVVSGGGFTLEALLGVLSILNDVVVGLATAAGPFSPIVIALIWIAVGALLGALIRRGLPWLIQLLAWVIPWV